MKILENILNGFKEILYDIMVYLLPGFITLLIFFLPISLQKIQAPIYSLLEIINTHNFKALQTVNNSSLFTFFKIILLMILSYWLGHIIRLLSTSALLKYIFAHIQKKALAKIDKKNSFLNELKLDLWDILKDKRLLPKSLFLDTNNTLKTIDENLLITYSTTHSRFISHNNLIQKYIAKVNMYRSLSCISLLLFVDSLLSGLCFIINNISTIKNLINILCLIVFLTISFSTSFFVFYTEFYRHEKLKEKECYFFLYHYLNRPNNSI